ncbi:DUF47 family protein [Desulfobacterales bacterium HSG16]|nr:DUF47 family protein [Desulfobacterales bacterium HSG16]
MRIPLLSMFLSSPFAGLEEHAEKIKECSWVFQQAIECHFSDQCDKFDGFREEIMNLENEADAIKAKIRSNIPKDGMVHVDRFQFFRYLKEQDRVLDSVEDALDWISCRSDPWFLQKLEKEFFLLVDAIIEPIEELKNLVEEAGKYFKNFSPKQKKVVEEIIKDISKQEHIAGRAEVLIRKKVLNMEADPASVFYVIRLAESIRSIARHAENACDVMRAMIAI